MVAPNGGNLAPPPDGNAGEITILSKAFQAPRQYSFGLDGQFGRLRLGSYHPDCIRCFFALRVAVDACSPGRPAGGARSTGTDTLRGPVSGSAQRRFRSQCWWNEEHIPATRPDPSHLARLRTLDGVCRIEPGTRKASTAGTRSHIDFSPRLNPRNA